MRSFPDTDIGPDFTLIALIKQHVHLKARGKCKNHEPQASVFYISRVFSNVRSILSQCNAQLGLLRLLYDIDFPRAKQ